MRNLYRKVIMRVMAWFVTVGIGFSAALTAAEKTDVDLPRDGAWVRYKVLIKHDTGREFDFKTTTKFLGREDIDGRPCRWIEIEWNKDAYRFLVPEKSLRDDEHPLDETVKADHRDANGDVRKATDEMVKSMAFALFFLPAAHQPAKRVAEPRTVESPAGKLKIADAFLIKESKTTEVEGIRYVHERECRIWVHPDLPLGHAHLIYKGQNKGGEMNLKWTQEQTLEEFGDDAQSAFSK